MNQAIISRMLNVSLPADVEREINRLVGNIADSIVDDPLEKVEEAVGQYAPEAQNSITHSDEWREAETRVAEVMFYGVKVGYIVAKLGSKIDEAAVDAKALANLLKGN